MAERCKFCKAKNLCGYPQGEFKPTASVDGVCQDGGDPSGCNKGVSETAPQSSEMHVLVADGVTQVLNYPPRG